MNLNNKYLAIGLSVAAVVLVSYQLFFNKTEPSTPVVPPLNPPAFVANKPPVTTPSSTPSATFRADVTGNYTATSASADGSSESAALIDYNSEILLKRVQPEMIEPYTPRDIPAEFGNPIFSKPTPQSEPLASVEPVKEVEFILNGIIIDSTRRLAIINDTILKIGDVILGAEVIAIVNNKVVLTLNQQEIVLSTDSKIKKLKLLGGRGDH